jgi:DNA-cytosine methyltransferase
MERTLTHGSLFTGIGGIDLGLEWAGFETAFQVEIDPFCNLILAKHWPDVPRFLDVRSVGKHNLTPVHIISGGFPCQDISQGSRDERGLHNRSGLWFEYARIVRELRPAWCLVENVPNLRDHGADTVLSDLEEAGYACCSTVVGVNVLGAPFKRQRVFILAHDNTRGPHNDADVLERLGSGVGGGTLLPDVARKMEETTQNWLGLQHELGAGDASPRSDTEEPIAAAYARGVREVHGIPNWAHKLRALGNSCSPITPALIGNFIQNYEKTYREGTATAG